MFKKWIGLLLVAGFCIAASAAIAQEAPKSGMRAGVTCEGHYEVSLTRGTANAGASLQVVSVDAGKVAAVFTVFQRVRTSTNDGVFPADGTVPEDGKIILSIDRPENRGGKTRMEVTVTGKTVTGRYGATAIKEGRDNVKLSCP